MDYKNKFNLEERQLPDLTIGVRIGNIICTTPEQLRRRQRYPPYDSEKESYGRYLMKILMIKIKEKLPPTDSRVRKIPHSVHGKVQSFVSTIFVDKDGSK